MRQDKLVLVADDNEDIAAATALLIEEALEVKTVYVTDGMKAVAQAGMMYPVAVVLDIDMPVVNGIDAAKAIRKLPKPPARIIALTAWPQYTLGAAMSAFDLVLSKPADPDKLLEAVASVL